MPAQGQSLMVTPNRLARVPGAINLTVADLTNDMIVSISTYGEPVAQTTLGELLIFFGNHSPAVLPRVEDSGGTIDMDDGSNFLVVDTTAGGDTTVNLPTAPTDGQVITIKDGGGQLDLAPGQAITLASAKNINGQSGLTMRAAWMVVTATFSEDLDIWLIT